MSIPARRRLLPDPDDAWNLRPIPPPEPQAASQTGRLVVVDNGGDELAASRHINALGRPGDGCAVVRPTPSAFDLPALGLDLLVAIGKNPTAAKTERVPAGECFRIGTSWLEGTGVTDLVIDRAHLLTAEQLAVLAVSAAELDATLWLLWGHAGNPFHTTAVARAQGTFARPAEMISLWEFYRRLPPPQRPPLPAGPAEPQQWPALPAADFATFLAACRRTLDRDDFAQVNAVYRDTAAATDAWLETADLPATSPARVTGSVIGWLRDHVVGPAPTPQTALARLRAVQAALFVGGILLRWQAGALGPDPARRLLGDLTPVISAHLHAICRTDAAAATALALHLNHTCRDFHYLTLGDIAPDGSAIRGPLQPGPTGALILRPPGHTEDRHPRSHERSVDDIDDGDTAWHEFACLEPILIPEHARAIFTAHLTYRSRQGACDSDPYFVHPTLPAQRSPAASLRGTVRRSCAALGLDPPWLHGDGCVHGTDVGINPRTAGWHVERGLSVSVLDHGLHRLPAPRDPHGRPRWTRRGIGP